MAAYIDGRWQALNLDTNMRRTGNNPYTADEFADEFPELSADDFLETFPSAAGGFNFITNDPEGRYESWTEGTDPRDETPIKQWTLETDNSKWADDYPDDAITSKTYYVGYNNKTKEYTGAVGPTKADAGTDAEGIKSVQITIDYSSGEPTYTDKDGNTYTGFTNFLQNQTSKDGTPLTGGGSSGAKDQLQTYRDGLKVNYDNNQAADGLRTAAMDKWNYDNVWVPASEYAETWNKEGATYREAAAEDYNTNTVADYREKAATAYNEAGDEAYSYNTALNTWSEDTISWAKNTQTGLYTANRAQIYDNVTAPLGDFVKAGLMTAEELSSIQDGLKDGYGAYYAENRVPGIWDPDTEGGTRDLLGGFDADYYVNEYGDSTGLSNSWFNATRFGNADNPYDPNNDLDITARYGSLDNYAHYNYSTYGKEAGLRGQEAIAAEDTETYKNTLTTEELNIIRDQILGLTGRNEYGETIEWAENILDPSTDQTVSLLEASVGNIFSAKDLEQQDKFAGLAQDVLRKSVDELYKQEQKERELDIYQSLPGFSEVYGSSKELANSILGDSGVGGYLSMMGIDTRSMSSDLEKGFEELTGISTNGAEYNWQKWMNNTIKDYENLEVVEGKRVDTDGNPVEYDLTTEENQAFMQNFIDSYITPRFNRSKSMSEFISYLDTQDEDKQNIFQTQTAMNKLKQTAETRAKAYFTDLSQHTGEGAAFDYEFYMDPTKRFEGLTEEELNNDFLAPAEVIERSENQKNIVQSDWAKAKEDPSAMADDNFSWEQLAYMYGLDINNEEQFAKLHFQVKGLKNQFEGAADLVDANTVNDWMVGTLLPLVQEEKISLKDAAFMQFVTPEEFASSLLEGIDPLENQEEWRKVLESIGFEDMDASLEEVKKYIEEAFETGEAVVIREGIKYLNEQKEEINQQTLGVDYIQRDPVEILGNPGDIEVGSEAWKELLKNYDIDENFNYDQAKNALLNYETIDAETRNPMYEIFRSNGYAGTEDEFMQEFFPEATQEDMADLDLIGRAMSGDLQLNEISSDPFAAMTQFEGFLGSSSDPYFLDDDEPVEVEDSYFDLFPGEKDYASSTGRGIIDSWTGGLFA